MTAVDQTISTILSWRLPQVGGGRTPLTFLDTVTLDEGLDVGDLKGVMLDPAVRRKIVEVKIKYVNNFWLEFCLS